MIPYNSLHNPSGKSQSRILAAGLKTIPNPRQQPKKEVEEDDEVQEIDKRKCGCTLPNRAIPA